jgi:hypothetical protein
MPTNAKVGNNTAMASTMMNMWWKNVGNAHHAQRYLNALPHGFP